MSKLVYLVIIPNTLARSIPGPLTLDNRLVSVHTSIDCGEVWWKKISAEACSGKEIAGLLKKYKCRPYIERLPTL